jgi:hypothetical protein
VDYSNLKNVFNYLLSWTWDSKGNPIPETLQMQQEKLQSDGLCLGNAKIKIKQLPVTTSHKTLGTLKCLVGREEDHDKYLKDKSDNLGNKIYTCQLNRRQSRMAYNSCYVPALLYSLTAVNLTKNQTDCIQQHALTNFIRKCGFDKHFPRSVVYGSEKFGGLGFTQLYVASCSNKIQSLLAHINSNTMLGKMFLINMNWTQMLTGLSTPILKENTNINYVTSNWFIGLCEFMRYISATIHILDCWTPIIKRQNDFVIMEKVQDLDIPPIKQQIFNNWRLYFQIDSLSDITNANGEKIQEVFLTRQMAKNYISTSRLKWPKQQMPSISTFSTWVNIIRQISNTTNTNYLQTKLGAWIVPLTNYRSYKYLINHENTKLLIHENEDIWEIEKSHSVR